MSAIRAWPQEAARSLPGDALIPDPMYSSTHAISIAAPATSIWPWLAQMGADRAGWYSWDFLDNGRRPSARRIVPDLQDPHPGDVMPALPGATDAFIVEEIELGRHLVLGVPDGDAHRATWTFAIDEVAPDGFAAAPRSRLLVRARLAHLELTWPVIGRRTMPDPLAVPIARSVHWIMVRRQLHGIRERCEATALADSRPASARS